jgi:SAM-dependent methyltransferase
MAYTLFDRFVARQRFHAALPHIHPGSRVCDIGCGHGAEFLRRLDGHIGFSVGLDYQALNGNPDVRLVRCDITRGLPLCNGQFDHAVMLAVFEHLENPRPILAECSRILAPGGSLIMTWPQPMVDPVLDLLHGLGFVSKEMESGMHQERMPLGTILSMLSEVAFERPYHRKFEFGMNNLLVCYKKAP